MREMVAAVNWEELRQWDGNLVMAMMQQTIYECGHLWFGCHWAEWRAIAMLSPQQYYVARRELVEQGKMKVKTIHIPRRRLQVICHTLDMAASEPLPGENLLIWIPENDA